MRRTGSDRGASAVEYGLLITAIAAVITAIVFVLGLNVFDLYHRTCEALYSTGCN